ncbi:SAM-dependent methyltransferase [Nonomuraea sp. NPDC050202]|uniref:SAM-dependent methyltransferase n=1 Tax=Nonomuraea sp. NPDC050202 TaxID=3155035 RepID=UPI0034108115
MDDSTDWRAGIDPSAANSARMYDYYLGGKDHFPADIAAARKVIALQPNVRPAARENRHFLRRAVTYLTQEAGIQQFLDIGAGLPTAGNVHEIAPEARVVYVDHDPVVITQARALLGGSDRVRVVMGDVRDPDAILEHPSVCRFLDFDEPLALLLVGLLHFVQDREGAYGVVARLRDALPSGSFAAISHGMSEGFDKGLVNNISNVYSSQMSHQLRTRAQVEPFLTGLDLVEPGLVPITEWRPDGISEGLTAREVGIIGAVGRVP